MVNYKMLRHFFDPALWMGGPLHLFSPEARGDSWRGSVDLPLPGQLQRIPVHRHAALEHRLNQFGIVDVQAWVG